MKVSEISAMLGTWVGICGAILGGYLALKSYQADVATRTQAESKQVNERVQAAFRIVEEFHRPDFIASRSRLVEAFTEQRADCRNFTPPSKISVQEVFTLVEYFDRAQLCIANGLCNKATTEQLLSPYANAWQPYLQRQIDFVRSQEHTADGAGYGMGLKALATQPVEAVPCPGAQQESLSPHVPSLPRPHTLRSPE
jgi:hypothetical protein